LLLNDYLNSMLDNIRKVSNTMTLEQLLQSHFASYLMQLPDYRLVFTNYNEADRKEFEKYYYKDRLDYSQNNIYNPIYKETIEPIRKWYKYYFSFTYDTNNNELIVYYDDHGEKDKGRFNVLNTNSLYSFLTTTDFSVHVKNYYEPASDFNIISLSPYVITLRAYFMQKPEENQHFQKMLRLVSNPELFTKNYNALHFIVNEIENRFIRMKEKTEIPRYLYPYMHYEYRYISPLSNVFIKQEGEVIRSVKSIEDKLYTFYINNIEVEFKKQPELNLKDMYMIVFATNYNTNSLLFINRPIELVRKIFNYHIANPYNEIDKYSLLSYLWYNGVNWFGYRLYTLYDDKSIGLWKYSPSNYNYESVKMPLFKEYEIRIMDNDTFLVRCIIPYSSVSNNTTFKIFDDYSLSLFNYHINLYKKQNEAYENMLKEGIGHLILNEKIFGDD